MKPQQIQSFVYQFLETTECEIIEKAPTHVTVKLSPEADRELTNRPYYWGFVDRTGVEPETMTYTFIFDPERLAEQEEKMKVNTNKTEDTILGRYFGVAPPIYTGRIPRDEITHGSRRLNQLFQIVKAKGRYVQMFEQRKQDDLHLSRPKGYISWLGVNFKVEFCCDMKRDELHSYGISLLDGTIVESFYDQVLQIPLTPCLPPNTLVVPYALPVQRAAARLEQDLEQKLEQYDHTWAEQAQERLFDEQSRIDEYYTELLASIEPDKKAEVEAQYEHRKEEIEWQYKPRIQISVINCGIFHLSPERLLQSDESR